MARRQENRIEATYGCRLSVVGSPLSVVGESVVGSLAVEVKQKHDGKKLKQKPHNIVYPLQVEGN